MDEGKWYDKKDYQSWQGLRKPLENNLKLP